MLQRRLAKNRAVTAIELGGDDTQGVREVAKAVGASGGCECRADVVLEHRRIVETVWEQFCKGLDNVEKGEGTTLTQQTANNVTDSSRETTYTFEEVRYVEGEEVVRLKLLNA
jgi:hypothetical protein